MRQLVRAETAILFIAGFVYSLSSTLHRPILGGGIEPLNIARSLAGSGTFADPFGYATGPTAHTGPIFPIYISGLMRLCVDDAALALSLSLGASLFHGFEIAILPWVSEAIFGDISIGFAAGLLSIIPPCYQILPQWESSLSGLVALLFFGMAVRIDSRHTARMFALGFVWGAALLLNPVLAMPTGIWAASAARKNNWRLGILLPLTTAILVCIPWTARNWIQLGGLVPVRDNFGLELQVSNNDLAAASRLENFASLARFHPALNAREAAQVRSLGELTYQREKEREALAWMAHHLRGFAVLSGRRILNFWFPPLEEARLAAAGIWIITLLSIPGIVLVVKRRPPIGAALLWTLVIAPLPYYVVQSDIRYRTPMMWVSLLLAAYALESALQKAEASQHAASRHCG